MSAPLDHGVLSVPLARRGNIDNAIDAGQPQQRQRAEKAAAKQQAQATREARAAAKVRLAEMLADAPFLARMSERTHLSPARVRRELQRLAYWEPEALLRKTPEAAA